MNGKQHKTIKVCFDAIICQYLNSVPFYENIGTYVIDLNINIEANADTICDYILSNQAKFFNANSDIDNVKKETIFNGLIKTYITYNKRGHYHCMFISNIHKY